MSDDFEVHPIGTRRLIAEQGLCVAVSELRLDDLQQPVITETMNPADIRYRRREAIAMYRSFCWHRDLYLHNFRVLTRTYG